MMVLLLRMRESQEKGKVRVFCGRKKKKRKKETSERKMKLEASLYTQKRVVILMKFPKYPFNKLQDITFFPPYKNSSSNFTNKEKE